MRAIRGNDISMIFQEPMTSLNPVLTVGRQIGETLRLHQGLDKQAAEARAVEMLTLVGIPEPARRVREYPHQLSGGMRQRVMIAMALACNPKLLIADEPTTALDVTIQAQILQLMLDLKRRVGAAIILITHDLGVVAEIAERVMVMYAGRKVEEAPVRRAVPLAAHPYTQGLLGAVPKLGSSLTGAATAAGRNSRPGAEPASSASRAASLPGAVRWRPISAAQVAPALEEKAPGHVAACHYAPQGGGRAHERPAARRSTTSRSIFRSAAGCSAASRELRLRRGRRVLRDRARRDAVAGRRIRLRQVDGRPRHPAAVRHHRRPGACWMASASTIFPPRGCAACAGACRWCSRIRSPASIRACACAISWPSRSAISASPSRRRTRRRGSRR